MLYVVFAGALNVFEHKNGIVRGTPGSELSAKVFGEYYPPPSAQTPADAPPSARLPEGSIDALVTPWSAFGIEVIGTAVLLLVIFCCVDERNANRPQILTAATIGLTVTLLISLLGPLTMACFNPARDLGPTTVLRRGRLGQRALHGQRSGLVDRLHHRADPRWRNSAARSTGFSSSPPTPGCKRVASDDAVDVD